jgi:hypothetical protein
MTDYRLPDLPSDEELGITEEDLKEFAESEADGPGQETPPTEPPPSEEDTGEEIHPTRWRGPLTLVVMVALAWVGSIRTGIPRPLTGDAPDTTFSAERAQASVAEIVRGPRPPGSPEHARVRALLLEALRELGLDPEVQTATAVFEARDFARAATVRNIVARIPGTTSTGAVLLTAHYDGVPLSPATGDDASGVATILETLRAVIAGEPLRNDVIVLFSDGEEVGLLGAEAFVRDHPWLEDIEVVLGFEMRGSSGPSILFETADQNGAVVRALRRGFPDAFGTSLGDEFLAYLPHATDFTVFQRAGKQGLNFAAIDNAAVYHTPRDLPSELASNTLQAHGMHALGALRTLGNADLSDVRAPDVVYFSLPAVGLVTYPVRWVLPTTGLLLLVAAGTTFLALRRGVRPSAVIVALGVSVVVLSLAYGAGVLLLDQTSGAHPEAGQLPGALYYGEGWYVLALAAVVLFLVGTALGLVGRRISVAELTLGGLGMPLAGTVVASFLVPLAAPPLQWAVLATLLSIAAAAVLGSRAQGWPGWPLGLILAAPVFILFTPLVELLWLAGTLRMAGLLGAFMACGFLLVIPFAHHVRIPNGWWMPLMALIGATASLGMARLGNEVSPVTPTSSTLAYQYDRGTQTGVWITDSTTLASPDTLAAAWLASRVAGSFTEVRDLSSTGYRPATAVVTAGPPASAPPLTWRVLQDTTDGAVRRVRVGLRSDVGAERIYVERTGGAAGTRMVGINGHRLTDPYAIRWVDHWGEPDSLVVLDLEMPAGSPAELVVSEHLLRPGELLGPGTFQRPPALQASVITSGDRAILTTRITVPGADALSDDAGAAREEDPPLPTPGPGPLEDSLTRGGSADSLTGGPPDDSVPTDSTTTRLRPANER